MVASLVLTVSPPSKTTTSIHFTSGPLSTGLTNAIKPPSQKTVKAFPICKKLLELAKLCELLVIFWAWKCVISPLFSYESPCHSCIRGDIYPPNSLHSLAYANVKAYFQNSNGLAWFYRIVWGCSFQKNAWQIFYIGRLYTNEYFSQSLYRLGSKLWKIFMSTVFSMA